MLLPEDILCNFSTVASFPFFLVETNAIIQQNIKLKHVFNKTGHMCLPLKGEPHKYPVAKHVSRPVCFKSRLVRSSLIYLG